MSRKSSAALSVITPSPLQRLAPPKGLTKEQAALWARVVESKPADWFTPDNAPMLAEYVRASTMCDILEAQIQAAVAGDDAAEVKAYLDMRDKESKRVSSLATKLRLTQQSRYTPQAAATATKRAGASRPWKTT